MRKFNRGFSAEHRWDYFSKALRCKPVSTSQLWLHSIYFHFVIILHRHCHSLQSLMSTKVYRSDCKVHRKFPPNFILSLNFLVYLSPYEPLLLSQLAVLLSLPGQLLLLNCSNPQGWSCVSFFFFFLELQQSALPVLRPPPEPVLKAYLSACLAWVAASSLALAAPCSISYQWLSYIPPPFPLPTPSSPHCAHEWLIVFMLLVFAARALSSW